MKKVRPQMQGEGTWGHRKSQIFQRGKASPFDPRCHCVDVTGCVWWDICARQLVTFLPYLWRHLPRAISKAQRRHCGEKLDLCIFLYFLTRNPFFVLRKCSRVSKHFKITIKPFPLLNIKKNLNLLFFILRAFFNCLFSNYDEYGVSRALIFPNK